MIYIEWTAVVVWSVFLWWFFVLPVWPWDWLGRRKGIDVRGRPRDWDDAE